PLYGNSISGLYGCQISTIAPATQVLVVTAHHSRKYTSRCSTHSPSLRCENNHWCLNFRDSQTLWWSHLDPTTFWFSRFAQSILVHIINRPAISSYLDRCW